MARSKRTRTRPAGPVTGQWDYPGGGYASRRTWNPTNTCSDYHGRPVTDSPFTSVQNYGPLLVSGQYQDVKTAGYWDQATNACPLLMPKRIGAYSSLPTPGGWAATVVARSNPSRPVTNVPELIEDVVGIPKLLRSLYGLLSHPKSLFTPAGVSNHYLGLQFGWLPMIEDFRKIANWQTAAARRGRELNQLYNGKGLRKRVTLASDTFVENGSDWFITAGSNGAYADISITVKRRVWGTVRWKPKDGLVPGLHPQDIRNIDHLRNIVLGWTPEGLLHGLWKVTPWTWLIGWFTNIGDYILLSSNTVPAVPLHICLMKETTVFYDVSGLHPTGTPPLPNLLIEVSGHEFATRKERIIASPVAWLPGFNMPFLGMFQHSILGSLAMQRIFR